MLNILLLYFKKSACEREGMDLPHFKRTHPTSSRSPITTVRLSSDSILMLFIVNFAMLSFGHKLLSHAFIQYEHILLLLSRDVSFLLL